MTEAFNLDRTIAAVYRAAMGSTTWPAALRCIAEDLDAASVQMLCLDPGNGTVLSSHASEAADEAAHDGAQRYPVRDPRIALLLERKAGLWLHCRVPVEDGLTPRAGDAGVPLDRGRHYAGVKLLEGRGEIVLATIRSRVGEVRFTEPRREYCERIGVHLRQALMLDRRLRHLAGGSELAAGLLAGNSRPMAIIGGDRIIAATNRSFDALVAERTLFQVVDGALVCAESPVERSLTVAMMEIADGASPEPTRVVAFENRRADAFAMRLALVSHKSPERGPGAVPQFLLSVLGRPALHAADTGAWQAAFGLSPAEARVAAHIFAGKAPKEVAKALAVCPSTVKTQLESIFAKTATTRQAELVGILSTLAS